MKKKHVVIIILSVLLTVVIAFAVVIVLRPKTPITSLLPIDNNATDWQGNQDLTKPHQLENTIAIPGFDKLVFVANQTEKQVNFYNPEENECLFLMELFVDGTSFWKSGYVEPGKGYYTITLSRPLQAGDYDASLNVKCFQTDGTALNSANVTFELICEDLPE